MRKLRQVCFCFLLATFPMPALMAVEVGQKAPNCTLLTFQGREHVTLNQLKGEVLYVDFWASWCPPCRESFPFMNALHRELGDQGLHIVGINLDEKLSDAKKFLDRLPAGFDIMLDPDRSCAKAFAVRAMPTSYLVGRNGVIRHIHLGFRLGDRDEIRAWVKKLLQD